MLGLHFLSLNERPDSDDQCCRLSSSFCRFLQSISVLMVENSCVNYIILRMYQLSALRLSVKILCKLSPTLFESSFEELRCKNRIEFVGIQSIPYIINVCFIDIVYPLSVIPMSVQTYIRQLSNAVVTGGCPGIFSNTDTKISAAFSLFPISM